MGGVDILLATLCLNINCSIDFKMEMFTNFDSNFDSKRNVIMSLKSQLKGQHLKLTTIQNYPLSYTVDENGTLVGKGVAFELLNIIQEKFEFEYSIILPKENVIGYYENSRFKTGVFELLDQNLADIAVALLPIIPQFGDKINYSTTIDITRWIVLMNRPHQSAQGTGILAPFTAIVWLLILISVIVVGPIIYGFIHLHKLLCKETDQPIYSIFTCSWFVYGALLKQGSVLNPVSGPTRFIFGTWWIFVIVLTAFYTANLIAFLTLSEFTLPLKSNRDIGRLQYHWVTKRGNAIENAINNPDEKLLEDLQGSFGNFADEDNLKVLDTWIKNKDYIYIGDKYIVNYLMYQDYFRKTREKSRSRLTIRCTYVSDSWAVLRRQRGFAYGKNFVYRHLFNYALQHLEEGGMRKHFKMYRLPDTTICPLNLKSKDRKLSVSNIKIAFYLIAGGFTLGFVIFLAELGVKYKMKKRISSDNTIIRRYFPSKTMTNKLPTVLPPPPAYKTLFPNPLFNRPGGTRMNINGTDYWVVKTNEGRTRLVPIRTPSAVLFQRKY